jgi:hypothetical protein
MANPFEDQIKTELLSCVQRLHADNVRGDKKWTKEFKRALIEMGRKAGYKVCASGSHHECEPEWLFDLTWYKEDGEGVEKRLVDVPLIVECEWNSSMNHIRGDFEKLVVSNASHRLMICQSRKQNMPSLKNYFEKAVNSYTLGRPGDRYLIAILDKKDEEFQFDVIVRS